MPDYLIQAPNQFDETPKVRIETRGDFTPAEAMDFALRIIEAVRRDVVLANRPKNSEVGFR